MSGGEAQRIRLASQLGANLTGVTYVLDEPECEDFKEYVLKEFKKYNYDVLGYNLDGWTFSQTWISHKQPGESHIPHTHPNSIISGVFFLQAFFKFTITWLIESPVSNTSSTIKSESSDSTLLII